METQKNEIDYGMTDKPNMVTDLSSIVVVHNTHLAGHFKR